ncbi:MAG: hypothetical protein IGS48_08730 [Oscillatoriales cyanobacterium C42_A2020_001]|nr:hypothetical protein [Leptolyngbyaceae cyanobacterium C42_A2020_001]
MKMTEFYQGWMIELIRVKENFQAVCHSPLGENFTDSVIYESQFTALQGAFRLIDQFYSCHALRVVLRELFEAGKLDFNEWQSLNQSLETFWLQFMRSPS